MLPRENERQKQMRELLAEIDKLSISDLAEFQAIAIHNRDLLRSQTKVNPLTPAIYQLRLKANDLMMAISNDTDTSLAMVIDNVRSLQPDDKAILNDRVLGVLESVLDFLPPDLATSLVRLSIGMRLKRIELEMAPSINSSIGVEELKEAARHHVNQAVNLSRRQVNIKVFEARKLLPHYPLVVQFNQLQSDLKKRLESQDPHSPLIQAITHFRAVRHQNGIRESLQDFARLLKQDNTKQNKFLVKQGLAEINAIDNALANQKKEIDKQIKHHQSARILKVTDKAFEPYLQYKQALKNAAQMIQLLEAKSYTLTGKEYEKNKVLQRQWESMFKDVKALYQPMLHKSDTNSVAVLKTGLSEIASRISNRDILSVIKPVKQSLNTATRFAVWRKVDVDRFKKSIHRYTAQMLAGLVIQGIEPSSPFVKALVNMMSAVNVSADALHQRHHMLEQQNDSAGMRAIALQINDMKDLFKVIAGKLSKSSLSDAKLQTELKAAFAAYIEQHPHDKHMIAEIQKVRDEIKGTLSKPMVAPLTRDDFAATLSCTVNFANHPHADAITKFLLDLNDQEIMMSKKFFDQSSTASSAALANLRIPANNIKNLKDRLLQQLIKIGNDSVYPNDQARQRAVDALITGEISNVIKAPGFPVRAREPLDALLIELQKPAPVVAAAPVAPTLASPSAAVVPPRTTPTPAVNKTQPLVPPRKPNPATLFQPPKSERPGDLADIFSKPPLVPPKKR